MSRRPFDANRLLRWYPSRWRERYGDEFTAYVDDALAGERPSTRFVWSIMLGALRERGHESGLLGEHHEPAAQSRAGSVLILCAWSIFILAGASFSKLSEHFARAMPAGSSSMARVGYDVVAVSGALGMGLLFVGAVVALPALIRFLGSGGWAVARRRIGQSVALSSLAIGAVVPLAHWAHHLTPAQRNGGDGVYSFAVVVWAVVIALAIVSWDRVVVQCSAKMTLSARVLRAEASLAVAVSLLMWTICAGTALWWVELATHAPWFLQGTNYGSSPSPLTANLLITMSVMVLMVGVSTLGVRRIARSWRHVPA